MILHKATIVTPEGNALSQEVANEGEALAYLFDHIETVTGEDVRRHALTCHHPTVHTTVWEHHRLRYRLEYLVVPV